jgi:SHS2 domain-containing protein
MDKKYEILEHPAELRLKIYGKTIEELFMNAAEAMADILATSDKRQGEKIEKESLKIQSIDLNSLLVDFLSEILARGQIGKCVYLISDIKIDVLGFTLHASVTGYPVDHFDEDIKAATYYRVGVEKNSEGIWQTEVVFDI